jgi:phosphoribosylformimino-5-aminoimidazole carboxamide ribotide isomerase
VRAIDTIARLVDAGAARVVLGTKLVTDKEFAQAAVEDFGDALTAGIDAKGGEVAIQGWREGAGVPAADLVREMGAMGYRHLVFTDIARDGMQTGIDAAAYERIASAFGHPVIASGGVATIDDVRALRAVADSIEGVITGRAVYEGTLDLEEALALCADL